MPPQPRSPNCEDYFEYLPESGEYTTSFKGILRAFGEEALGKAKPYLADVSVALDHLLRNRFPAAAAAASASAPINRDVLNTFVDEYVSDRGIGWVKDHANGYDKTKKNEISGVNYRRECNIVFLPARIIEYSLDGKTYVAISDTIRNEYLLGTPPAVAPAAPRPPVAALGKSNFGLIAGSAGAAVLLISSVSLFLLHGGKPAAGPTVAQQTRATNTLPAALAQNILAQQAARLAAAEATQKAAIEQATNRSRKMPPRPGPAGC
jgi:hypothetical protein